MSSNGGTDRVTNKELYDSQSKQDDATQVKLDRLEEKIERRPTTKVVVAIVTVSVAANQAAGRLDELRPAVNSALALIGF